MHTALMKGESMDRFEKKFVYLACRKQEDKEEASLLNSFLENFKGFFSSLFSSTLFLC